MGVFIIAEAGVNHNGDIETAKEMIYRAKEAGCDCVKFQTFFADDLVTKEAPQAQYQALNLGKRESQYDMLKCLELGEEAFRVLKDLCKNNGIEFMSTPFDPKSVDILERIGVERYKMSSGDITNKPLLEYVAAKNKPVIISTGMSTLQEVKDAVKWIEEVGNTGISILHCTSNYPAPYSEVNMNAMKTMMKSFSYPIGYSDHTKGYEIPIMAVAMGACIIEKHFTLDKSMPGPDHKASLDYSELKEMVSKIRHVEDAFGDGEKRPEKSEMSTREVARKSIVAACSMKAGEIIRKENLAVKRPGNGLAPSEIQNVIGKRLARDIERDEMVKWTDIIGT